MRKAEKYAKIIKCDVWKGEVDYIAQAKDGTYFFFGHPGEKCKYIEDQNVKVKYDKDECSSSDCYPFQMELV